LAERLVKEGKAFLKGCRSARTGKSYNATVVMTTGEDGRVQFSLEFGKKGGSNAEAKANHTSRG